ncbi:MAG: flavodoxin-dependent (E)-4-hydroxy-3-methylbut-2-enyl-diphosphate synthase [Lentisphaeria bacterium]
MRTTRQILIGRVPVGGGAPVSVQTMTTTDTRDAAATLVQIRAVAAAGCDIVRVAVPDAAAIDGLKTIAAASPLPVVADIHFDRRLALAAIAAGAHGIRVNPGNLGGRPALREVGRAAAARNVAVRVGVNGGSLEARFRAKGAKGDDAAALAASALDACAVLDAVGCRQVKVSLKSSSVPATVDACRVFAGQCDYPLHLGVTEAGPPSVGIIKSAVALGCLLLEGIGDTLRVSLTAPPVEEVRAGLRILEACGHRQARPELISCPTCGRTEIDLFHLVAEVEAELERLRRAGRPPNLGKIAIMGCVVNGPGEARDADLGLAGGPGKGVIFRRGEVIGSWPEAELLPAFLNLLREAAKPAGRQRPPATSKRRGT